MLDDLTANNITGSPFAPLFAVRNLTRILELTGLLVFASAGELMSLDEAAEYRGVSPACLGELVRAGGIPSHPVYSRNRKKPHVILVRKVDLDALPPVRHPNARKFRKAKGDKGLAAGGPGKGDPAHT